MNEILELLERKDSESARKRVSLLLKNLEISSDYEHQTSDFIIADEDPLSHECALDTYPSEPLTIENAKLCDTVAQPVYRDSWRCPEDPTCRTCKAEFIEKFTELQAVCVLIYPSLFLLIRD